MGRDRDNCGDRDSSRAVPRLVVQTGPGKSVSIDVRSDTLQLLADLNAAHIKRQNGRRAGVSSGKARQATALKRRDELSQAVQSYRQRHPSHSELQMAMALRSSIGLVSETGKRQTADALRQEIRRLSKK